MDPNPPTGQPLPTLNQPAHLATEAVGELLQDGEKAAEKALIAAYPWLAVPVVRQLWQAVFDWITAQITKPLATYAGHVVITVEEYAILQGAIQSQAALDAAKKTGDSDAITKASAQVDQAVAVAIHYIGASK